MWELHLLAIISDRINLIHTRHVMKVRQWSGNEMGSGLSEKKKKKIWKGNLAGRRKIISKRKRLQLTTYTLEGTQNVCSCPFDTLCVEMTGSVSLRLVFSWK